MPCSNPNHVHHWPTAGTVYLEKCERFCALCVVPDQRYKKWPHRCHLRRHLQQAHKEVRAKYKNPRQKPHHKPKASPKAVTLSKTVTSVEEVNLHAAVGSENETQVLANTMPTSNAPAVNQFMTQNEPLTHRQTNLPLGQFNLPPFVPQVLQEHFNAPINFGAPEVSLNDHASQQSSDNDSSYNFGANEVSPDATGSQQSSDSAAFSNYGAAGFSSDTDGSQQSSDSDGLSDFEFAALRAAIAESEQTSTGAAAMVAAGFGSGQDFFDVHAIMQMWATKAGEQGVTTTQFEEFVIEALKSSLHSFWLEM